jgi:ABC-type Mn2+/Zn2+ transport system permease subunit
VTLLSDPFTAAFMLRALLGGVLVAVMCAVVGTWVVTRGMAFLGEAMAHGVLPGVAVASLLGAPALAGAALSAAAMSLGVSVVQRRWRLSADTSIGLLFVASLALGVVIISGSGSFATDATAILFGDILAVRAGQLVALGAATIVTLALTAGFHRSFVALAVDPRLAQLLGLRPRLAAAMLTGLVALAVVSAYQAVGSLLVVGMLLGPAVAAGRWTTRLPTTMALGAAIGAVSVWAGLLISWYTATAAGATIALVAVLAAPLSAAIRALTRSRSGRIGRAADSSRANASSAAASSAVREPAAPAAAPLTSDPPGVESRPA